MDTSAIAKRYLSEVGDMWVRSVMQPSMGHVVIISELTTVEMFSVLARKHNENVISTTDLTVAQTAFPIHIEKEYVPVALDSEVLVLARTLTGKHRIRALDALQLGSALRAGAFLSETLIFVGSDIRLLAAATADGFATDNPLLHP